MKNTTTQFDFSAKPRVTALKPKYREREEDRVDGSSLMNDPRVIRGNTYAANVENKNQVQPPPRKKPKELPKQRERRINFDTGFEPNTPRALDGREHFTVQTEPFVQTLRDKPIQYEKQCQTDLFLDRPVERQFDAMKGKDGTDHQTQIEENDPELFNFDYEVQPIVEALLSKIVETSRMQLYEEFLIKQKYQQKKQYEQRRHSRLAEAQKLENNQNRLKEQYQRRQLQNRTAHQQEQYTQQKIICRILSKQYLKNLKNNADLILEQYGFFKDPIEADLLNNVMPWLYEQIINELHLRKQYQQSSKDLTQEAQNNLRQETQAYIQAEEKRRNNIIAKRQEQISIKKQKKEEARLRKEQQEKKKNLIEEQQQQQKIQAEQQPNNN